MPTMKMGPVTNPANSDKMKVQPNAPKPPPITPVTNPRDVGVGQALLDEDLILAAQGANGSILNAGNGDATIASFSEGPPEGHAVIEVNYDEVSTVDEYYDNATGLTDSTLNFSDGQFITIRG